jgi:transposase
VDEHKLLVAKVVGVDSTTLEVNAAMKSIVRRDTGETWNESVTRPMREEGVIKPDEGPSFDEPRRFDRQRKDRKVSNDERESPSDGDARIVRMKDGRMHLPYKAEHLVDVQTEVILSAEVYAANRADTATLVPSLQQAQENVAATESGRVIEKAAADKGYHAAGTLVACQESDLVSVKTYIPEPAVRRRWTDKTAEEKALVLQNRARTERANGKRLQRMRSEFVERSFAPPAAAGARGCVASNMFASGICWRPLRTTWAWCSATCLGPANRGPSRPSCGLSNRSTAPNLSCTRFDPLDQSPDYVDQPSQPERRDNFSATR